MSTIYQSLSAVKFLSKSYTFKFLFIAFLGIHIPLIGLIAFILLKPNSISPTTVFITTLVLTLAATGVTLYVLRGLLAPLRQSRAALKAYYEDRKLPNLPTEFQDEAGQLMKSIQQSITQLDGLLQEKKDLIGLLSHDLRTPMGNILMLSECLEEEPVVEDQQRKEYAGLIRRAANEQLQLMQRVLDMLREEENYREFLLKETKVEELVHNVTSQIETAAEKKNIEIVVEKEYDGEVMVEPEMFRQVLVNLLNNAVKFSFPGSKIKLAILEKNDRVLFRVADKGMGFDPNDAEELFEKFTSRGRKGTADEPSTGMGLYLSRRIIAQHHGKLTARSEGAGKGSTFQIEI